MSLEENKINNLFKNSLTSRLFVIGFIILVLLIPLEMIQDLIRERERNQNQAFTEISSKWGEMQVVIAPCTII